MDVEGFPLPYAGIRQGEDARGIPHLDEEGFPLLEANTRRHPVTNGGLRRRDAATDQESGEATGRRVMVLRRPPPHRQHHEEQVYNGQTFQGQVSQPVNNIIFTNVILSELSSMRKNDAYACASEGKEFWNRSPSHYPHQLHSKRRRRTSSLRVPTDAAAVPDVVGPDDEKGGAFCISMWMEYFLGSGVLHPNVIKFDRRQNNCDTWYKLWCAYVKIISCFSYYFMWIKRIFLAILRVFAPCIGSKLMFCHYAFIHINIHQEGEMRHLNAKFYGTPFGGVSLYLVRTLCCPFCRAEYEAKMSLRYFQSTVSERKKNISHG